ncbi:MAG: trigger factor [Peptococcaceae bacterium]|nr:trigger factor [Peptococcaceae bacterium]
MKTDMKNLENNRLQIEVTVDEAEVAEALHGAYKKVVAKVNMPGFRKGKVPVQILEARYGAAVLHDEALDILLPKVYERVLVQAMVKPISRPEVEVVHFARGENAQINFVLELLPEINVQEYKGIAVSKPRVLVSEEQVENELKKLAERHARLVDMPEDTLAVGDTAGIDYVGSVDGVPFAGGEAAGQTLEIGSGKFIPGFEEQLVGMACGEERTIAVTFPATYHSAELAGQLANFKVVLHDIKRKQLPVIDDDFAREISEHDTLADMLAEIRANLEMVGENNAKKRIENEVVATVVEGVVLDVPKVLVEEEMDSMLEDMSASLSRSKLKLEQYLEYLGKTKGALREEFRDSAANRVKTRLVLEKISDLENITVEDAEIEAYLAAMGQGAGKSAVEVAEILQKRGQFEAVRASIITGKTIDYLVSVSVVKEDQEVE